MKEPDLYRFYSPRLLGIAEGERRTLEAWQNVDIERSSRL
jgi:hypothetical protein